MVLKRRFLNVIWQVFVDQWQTQMLVALIG